MEIKNKLTVITPFYKAEKYIEKCIKSLLNQDLVEVQYIFVNDGSPDNADKIVQKYAAEDNRILLLEKENGGQSSARNMAMKYADGKYILYVDADDYLEPNVLGNMVKAAEDNNLDILRAVICDVKGDEKTQIDELDNPGTVMTGRERLGHNMISYSLCAHMYRRDFLLQNNIVFMEGVYHEDMDYVPRTLYYAQRVMDLDLFFYNYVVVEGSTTNHYSLKRVEDVYRVAVNVSEFVDKEVSADDYDNYFREYLAFMFAHVINLCIVSGHSLKDFLASGNKKPEVLGHLKKSKQKKYKLLGIMLKLKLYKLYTRMYLLREKKVGKR